MQSWGEIDVQIHRTSSVHHNHILVAPEISTSRERNETQSFLYEAFPGLSGCSVPSIHPLKYRIEQV